jgi:hypothetical protein
MPESKQKRFVYKVAKLLKSPGDPKITLESLLKAAIKKVPTAFKRIEKPAGSDTAKRFINYSLTHSGNDGNGLIFGCEFFAYEEGEGQSTIQIDPEAKEVSVDAVIAGKGKEFLAGSVYFGVSGNHVIVAQSRGLKVQELENYLNWLLVVRSKVLSDENRVSLNDHVPKSKKALFKGVRGIEIKGPVQLQPSAAVEAQAAKDQEAASALKRTGKKKAGEGTTVAAPTKSAFYPVKLAGKAWEAVKTLVGDSFQLPSEINVDDLADTPDIEVQISLKWKGHHAEDDSDFLDSVASNLRHIDDELDYEIRSASGTLGRDDIKIFKMVSIPWTKTGRPQFEVIFPKMADWLAGLVTDGKVDL